MQTSACYSQAAGSHANTLGCCGRESRSVHCRHGDGRQLVFGARAATAPLLPDHGLSSLDRSSRPARQPSSTAPARSAGPRAKTALFPRARAAPAHSSSGGPSCRRGARSAPEFFTPRRFGSALLQPAGARMRVSGTWFSSHWTRSGGSCVFEACRAGSRSASSPPRCPGGNASPGREVPGSVWAGGGRMETGAEDAGLSCSPMLASSWDAACGALTHSLHLTRADLGARDLDWEEPLAPPAPGCAGPAGSGAAAAERPRSWGRREGRRGPCGERVWAWHPGAQLATGLCGERGPASAGAGGRGRGRECRARGWRPRTRTSAGSEPGSASLSPHKRTSEGLLSPVSALINVTVQSPQQLRYGKDRRLPLSVFRFPLWCTQSVPRELFLLK